VGVSRCPERVRYSDLDPREREPELETVYTRCLEAGAAWLGPLTARLKLLRRVWDMYGETDRDFHILLPFVMDRRSVEV